jgi:hypothetical protein
MYGLHISANFFKLSKVNTRPRGENSPNLITLVRRPNHVSLPTSYAGQSRPKMSLAAGLPDFSGQNIPKRGKMYPNNQKIPNVH